MCRARSSRYVSTSCISIVHNTNNTSHNPKCTTPSLETRVDALYDAQVRMREVTCSSRSTICGPVGAVWHLAVCLQCIVIHLTRRDEKMAVASLTLETAAVLCAVVGCVVFFNSLNLELCFDDSAAIVENADLRPNVSWFNLLRNDFWGVTMEERDSHKSYRPLTVATFRLNYMLHELQPLGYHLVNVLLHSAVCYLYVLLCGVVFSEVWPALIAGLLFAVHPIHTEAVSHTLDKNNM